MQNYESKLIDSSRMVADILTTDILDDQERFDEMFELSLREVYPISMRAARIIELSTFKHKHLIVPHLNELINAIDNSKIEGVRRSYLKILTLLPFKLDEDAQGRLVDMAFSFLSNNKEAIAIRAYSIDFLLKIILNYPELKNELIYVLEEMTKDASTGLRTKSKKTIAQLNKKAQTK
jgi:hypothetical protein